MEKFFGKKVTDKFDFEENDKKPSESSQINNINNIQKFDLYNKGINHMANEKLSDAIRCFELSLRIDPKFVNAWIKKGYAHFHLAEYSVAISCYDNALDLDINNYEAWNLKGLAYYRMNNLLKAIECCEKSIDINHNNGMAWYNMSCYLVLDGRVDDGMEALKRAIEIDISYAKRAVRDKDFENAKAEEGFRRIIEVVVLEAIRHGYDYTGKIIWITGMDKADVDDALLRLSMKGLVLRKEKKNFFSKEEYFELSKEIALKVGTFKRSGFMGKSREVSPPVQQLKDISEILSKMRDSVEQGDVDATITYFDKLINPSIHGSTMIEKFFNEHRDLRLYQNRLKDKGQEYLNSHKSDFIKLMIEIDSKVRGTHLSNNVIDN
ncbi:MAG TPA: tetratricopeptide repeat protein [Nitrososphaeraceae archaeon]|jgi:tetratricopeptide (TPR) repeat protein|nr:tetratricopeptide repeat protein [Nitrososphaeraceae archaeon]